MTQLPSSAWPQDLSPDGRYTWDGAAWQPNPVSPDGQYFLYRNAWHAFPQAAPAAGPVAISSRPVSDLVGAAMTWRGGQYGGQLLSGQDLFGTLEGQPASLATGAGVFTAVTRDGTWSFEQPHSARPWLVVITDPAAGVQIAQFDLGRVGSPEFTLPSGLTVCLRQKSAMQRSWEWVNIRPERLVFLDRFAMPNFHTLTMERNITIDPAAVDIPELSLLVVLGHFLSQVVAHHTR